MWATAHPDPARRTRSRAPPAPLGPVVTRQSAASDHASSPRRSGAARGDPGTGSSHGCLVDRGKCAESLEDERGVDQTGVDQCTDEVAVLLSERAELGDTEVLLVEAPAGELGCPGGSCGVAVLDLDQSVSPAVRQDSGLQVDAVNAEAVEFPRRLRTLRPRPRSDRPGGRVPRIAWDPTTITSDFPMIWQAVRIACSSWSRRMACVSAGEAEKLRPLLLRNQSAHR